MTSFALSRRTVTGPDGRFRWPERQAERDALASRLLGAVVVQDMDSWLRTGLAELRDLGLTEDQRRAVEGVLGRAVSGTVFSVLVSLDQFPEAIADVVLNDPDTGERLASVGAGEIFDLHASQQEAKAEAAEERPQRRAPKAGA